MAATVSTAPGRERVVMNVTEKSLNELFETKGRIEWPWIALVREPQKISAGVAQRQAQNLHGLLTLFPSIGSIYEDQSETERLLEKRAGEARLIYTKLAKREHPQSWEVLTRSLSVIVEDVHACTGRALDILSANNMTPLEQGLRRPEFKALKRFLAGTGGRSPLEVVSDGDFYLKSRMNEFLQGGQLPTLIWKSVIIDYLTRQYRLHLDSDSTAKKILKEHITKVEKLSPGALYAYVTILSLVYPLPERPPDFLTGAPAPLEYAPNAVVWIDEWFHVYPPKPRQQRVS